MLSFVLAWKPSLDAVEAVAKGNPDALIHIVRVFISRGPWNLDQAAKQPEMVEQKPVEVPLPDTSVRLEAPVGHRVFCLVALVSNRYQVTSPASPFEFILPENKFPPPGRPTELHVKQICTKVSLTQAPPAPVKPPEAVDMISIFGHPDFKAGSMGAIVSINQDNIRAKFPRSTLSLNGEQKYPEGEEIEETFLSFPQDFEIQVVLKDQTIINVDKYLEALDDKVLQHHPV
jgi:hypothetical protein